MNQWLSFTSSLPWTVVEQQRKILFMPESVNIFNSTSHWSISGESESDLFVTKKLMQYYKLSCGSASGTTFYADYCDSVR